MRWSVLGYCLMALLGAPATRADIGAASVLASEIEHGEHAGFESFIMKTNGEVVARYVSPALTKAPPDLRSATKSITALLVGIALDRGDIASVHANVAKLLPAEYGNLLSKDPEKAKLTIEDLLTMRSGLACNDWDPKSPGHEDKMYGKRDWVAFWASQPIIGAPGERFSYCTGNIIALGVLLEEATHSPIDQYAASHLFGPLGIMRADWAHWNRGKRTDTGGHLRLAPDDLLKLGELVLARGRIADKQIVSSTWIEAMTHPHAEIPGTPQMYGYLWWLDRTKTANLPSTELCWAQGNGGNLLIVLPGVKTVIVTTGTRFNRPDALEPMFWLRDRILPGLNPSRELSQ